MCESTGAPGATDRMATGRRLGKHLAVEPQPRIAPAVQIADSFVQQPRRCDLAARDRWNQPFATAGEGLTLTGGGEPALHREGAAGQRRSHPAFVHPPG